MRAPEALHRLEMALGAGAGLVLVGGAVRDLLLGRPGGDWDLATALLPDALMSRATAAGFRCIPTGLQHGTVTVMAGSAAFEVTTYRGDGPYLDGRRPSAVTLGVSLEEDLARRDFTVNAMALPASAVGRPDWRAALVDPFGGQADLEAGLLRAVGDPLLRFQEDGLRPLRACRFVAQLGFRMEAATLDAIGRRLDVARRVAVERVLAEFTKLLCGAWAAEGLDHARQSGLLGLWLPECGLAAWGEVLGRVQGLPPEPAMRWAALLSATGGAAALEGLKASRQLRDRVAALLRHRGARPGSDADARRLLSRLRQDRLELEAWCAFEAVSEPGGAWPSLAARLETLAAGAPPLDVGDLALEGRALMALAGRPGGPWLGELQRHLLERVLETPGRNAPGTLEAEAKAWLAAQDSVRTAGWPMPRKR